MLHAMDDAWDSVGSGDIVIVSPQLPICMTHRRVIGRSLAHDPRRRRCALSSITTFERRRATGPATGPLLEVHYRDTAAGLSAHRMLQRPARREYREGVFRVSGLWSIWMYELQAVITGFVPAI